MTTKFNIVIPARYASSRFPGKPLVEIAGKAMLLHVYERAVASEASDIIVATDDQRIADLCDAHKLRYLMTSVDHPNGTDRIAEVADIESWTDDVVVVGLQGDEPATPPAIINQVARNLHANPQGSMATLCARITQRADYLDANRVKVVFDNQGFALYFSRAPIPWRRDALATEDESSEAFPESFVHIGMYAYRTAFLRAYSAMSETIYEQEEKLEQLRALCHGHRIHVDVAEAVPGHGVDHPNDVAMAERALLELG